MEIDLNHAVTEVEKNAYCNGDCGKGACVCCLSSSTSSCSSNSSGAPVSSSIYLELWHACAGPLTSLPKKGNVVVYFPQGHLEQAASSSPFSPSEMPSFDLHPQIFCRVVNVQLLANKENDEVYTQVTLLPQPELAGKNLDGKELEELGVDEEGGGGSPSKSTPHMFCKTLTASDTSTHGGFSVPRRAAEDCFPPLDYKQQRPSQELVAKDLHGVEWPFRHIYRGQPRRHLLTTGWSIFVSQKNLVAGDAVLFLRGENGELRLGIRRAVRPRNGLPDSIVGNENSYPKVFSLVANAISAKSMFHVFYSPRASHAEFVISYQKYVKSITNPVTIGTRFKMRFEMDDSPERRCSGVVTGISDLDPYRWPNSKWRSLMVRWDDEDIASDPQDRVSPWEIDPSVSLPPLSIQSSPRLKKLRTSLQATPPDNPVTAGGGGFLDFEESVRSPKVLQGQENVGFISPFYGCDTVNRLLDFEMRSAAHQNRASTGVGKSTNNEFLKTRPTTYTGFVESDRFPKVLQGQEICPLRSLTRKSEFNTWAKLNPGCNSFNMYQEPKPNFYPLQSESLKSMYFPYNDMHQAGKNPRMRSYATNLPRENVSFNSSSVQTGIITNEFGMRNLPNEHTPAENVSAAPTLGATMRNTKDENFNGNVTGCKLFGFSLTGETPNSHVSGSQARKLSRKSH
ncbi:auxin response factor 4 isoform X3 [Alnus glutinosa]|uniref:auxin response factor 4 isoform X3 n=1 Tax=Alnus glutinosa TaxID=3517 RepID=UPI002D76EB97|nr:auxin response factor 4 isoform X3 [Alnus glutinosa]